jgi:DNA-binding MarR family transcriptional regulator
MDLTPPQRKFLIAATRTKSAVFKWRVLGERIGLGPAKCDQAVLRLEQLGLVWREDADTLHLTPTGKVIGEDLRRWYGPVVARPPRNWRKLITMAAVAAVLATGAGLLVAVAW